MLNRREFLSATIATTVLAAPLAAEAQRTRTARIGYLATFRAAPDPRQPEAFLQGLRDLGYMEGSNLVIERRSAEGEMARLPTLAAELVALNVDVIVAVAGTLPALAARQATRDLPIVFIAVGDPVETGLAMSLSRPAGNATGLSAVGPDLLGKQLEILKQAAPGVNRVALLWQPGGLGEQTDKSALGHAEVAARALEMQLQPVEAHSPSDIDNAFVQMAMWRANALIVLSTSMFGGERKRIVDLAAKHRLPTVSGFRLYVDAGGLLSYGPDLVDLFRRAATYVDRILKGAKPGDLPIEQPTKFELVINLKTGRALGLTIPPSLLLRADQVIE